VPDQRDRDFYRRGLDDYHDPTAGIGGAPPARSALTLRLWLAGFGLLFCTVAAIIAGFEGARPVAVGLGVIAVIAAVNLGWVAYRKARGEPG
jgi:Family of unknown function (DUF6343)